MRTWKGQRCLKKVGWGWVGGMLSVILVGADIYAQETDITQTPNQERAGIQNSLIEQIGPGRGDLEVPNSSRYIIGRDPFRSIRRGRNLFQRKFTVAQGLGPRTGDGHGVRQGSGVMCLPGQIVGMPHIYSGWELLKCLRMKLPTSFEESGMKPWIKPRKPNAPQWFR